MMAKWSQLLFRLLLALAAWEFVSMVMFVLPTRSTLLGNHKSNILCREQVTKSFAHFTPTYFSRERKPLRAFLLGSNVTLLRDMGICRLPEGCGPNCGHFPHVAAFLMKCFSYWNQLENTTSKRILVTSLVNENPWRPFFKRSDFNRAMILQLYRYFGVRVVNSRPNLTGVIGTDDWDSFSWADPVADTDAWRMVMGSHRKQLTCPAVPRIRILNRRRTRSILNVESVAAQLTSFLDKYVSVHYFEKTSYREQVQFMSETDILVSPHGAQLTSLAVMPKCGGVLELFPVGYYTPKFFGSLAAISLHDHYTAYNGVDAEMEMRNFYQNHTQRVMARSVNFCVKPTDLMPMVETMIRNWRVCCRKVHESL